MITPNKHNFIIIQDCNNIKTELTMRTLGISNEKKSDYYPHRAIDSDGEVQELLSYDKECPYISIIPTSLSWNNQIVENTQLHRQSIYILYAISKYELNKNLIFESLYKLISESISFIYKNNGLFLPDNYHIIHYDRLIGKYNETQNNILTPIISFAKKYTFLNFENVDVEFDETKGEVNLYNTNNLKVGDYVKLDPDLRSFDDGNIVYKWMLNRPYRIYEINKNKSLIGKSNINKWVNNNYLILLNKTRK